MIAVVIVVAMILAIIAFRTLNWVCFKDSEDFKQFILPAGHRRKGV